MSLLSSSLKSVSSLSPIARSLGSVTNRINGLSSQVTSNLAAAGQSLKSASSFATAKADSLLSSAPGLFSTMAALGGGVPSIERIARSALLTTRAGGAIQFDPTSVMKAAKSTGTFTDSKVYPYDLENLSYKLTMEFLEYQRPNLAESANTAMRFAISLPLPNNLIESYGVAYTEGKYGAVLGAVVGAVDTVAAGNEVNFSGNTAIGAARGLGQGKLASLTGSMTGIDSEGISGLADQVFGSIVNPHLATFFSGPTMREHAFSWVFAPKNAKDSSNLKEIYYRIKRAMLPEFTPEAGHTTLEYPMMVRLKLMTKGNKELYPVKMCVISSASMNYAATGTPAFHTDGAPVVAQLSLGFKEIEYFTSNDIEEFQGQDYNGFESDFNITPGLGLNDVTNFLNNGIQAANSIASSIASDEGLQNSGILGSSEENG